MSLFHSIAGAQGIAEVLADRVFTVQQIATAAFVFDAVLRGKKVEETAKVWQLFHPFLL